MEESATARVEVLARQLSAQGRHTTSVWDNISQAPGDPILMVSDAWRVDPHPSKLNLGVGAYRTEEGKPLVLSAVRKAEADLAADPASNKEYLPITGDPAFCRLACQLAFGADHPVLTSARVATVQGLSGTGSLRVGAEFLGTQYPVKAALIPNPTWPTHPAIFTKAGLKVSTYRYWDAATKGLDFRGMLEDLERAEEGAVVVLHACAHNPTGVDPTTEQWREILEVVRRRHLLPFFDSAYQGFASGDLDADAAAVRMFAAATTEDGRPMEMLLAQSFAKNMGLYGERVGALSIVASDPSVIPRIQGQLRLVIRPMYSNPPRHGAEIAARILGSPELLAEWREELRGMAGRIRDMRVALRSALEARHAPGDWSFVTSQIGMFTFTGLSREQCQVLTQKHHVYLTMDGRISMAGLNAAGADALADSIAGVLASGPV